MANFANPRKKFNFSVFIIPGVINPFLFQKVTTPDIEIEADSHGDTNHDIKTAGRVSYGNIVCEKLMPSNSADRYMWDWLETCQSSILGGGTPPSVYKRTAEIVELAEDGLTPINRWVAYGVWPQKINGLDLNRAESGNTIENFELSVDRLQKL